MLAALANGDARRVYAEIILNLPEASGISARKRERAVAVLTSSGLIRESEDGSLEPVADAAAEILAHTAEPQREGVHRFVRDGMIEQFPVRPADRHAVLAWVVDQAIDTGETLTEPELGKRLELLHPDVATLRRDLVDEGLLMRTPSGTSYSRA